MLKRVIEQLIEIGRTDGLAEKIDIFYAAGKLTEVEWGELTELLQARM